MDTPEAASSPAVKPLVLRWSDIPAFDDEADEAAFWAEHQLDARLMAAAVHKAVTPESAAITLRLDPRMLQRIKRLARGRFLDHQAMIVQWLAERLEKEN